MFRMRPHRDFTIDPEVFAERSIPALWATIAGRAIFTRTGRQSTENVARRGSAVRVRMRTAIREVRG